MLSAGRPVVGSVIATRPRHVSAAQVRTSAASSLRVDAFSPPGRKAGAEPVRVAAPAEAAGARAKAAREAAPPTRSLRRDGATAGVEVMGVGRSDMGLFSVPGVTDVLT